MLAAMAVLASLAGAPGVAAPSAIDPATPIEALQTGGQSTQGQPVQSPEPQPKEKPAGSDAPADEKKPPTPEHTGIKATLRGVVGDVKHLPAKDNLYLALLGGGLALAAHPIDQTFNARMRSHYTFVNDAYLPAKYFGDTPVQVGLSLGTYALGRVFDAPKASHLGMDLLRAQILTEVLVQSIKVATQRVRPDASNSQSFPSGHAAITFAGATVLERHLGWKRSALAYAAAAYVATSRLHDNRHYLSDVAFGAAVGTLVGRTVTQHGHDNWSFMPVPVPGGVAFYAMRLPLSDAAQDRAR